MAVDSEVIVLSRRQFLKASSTVVTGLVLGFYSPDRNRVLAEEPAGSEKDRSSPNPFLRVAPDNAVAIVSKHVEGGPGIYAGRATILAEEHAADWTQTRVEPDP